MISAGQIAVVLAAANAALLPWLIFRSWYMKRMSSDRLVVVDNTLCESIISRAKRDGALLASGGLRDGAVEEEHDEIRKRGGSDSEERGEICVRERERSARWARRENSGRNLDVITPVYRVNSHLVIAIFPAGFSCANGPEITLASFCGLIRRDFPRWSKNFVSDGKPKSDQRYDICG